MTLTPRPEGRVHVVGAGPVGLFLAALLQSVDGCTVRLYERRPEYTRTRMVSLAPYLVADSLESYKADMIDWENVEAIFEPTELETRMAYRRSVAADLRALLIEWTRGFIALKTIEQSLSELIDARDTGTVERISGEVSADQALSMVEPGDILVDCTGTRSLLRDLLLPGDDQDTGGRNTTSSRGYSACSRAPPPPVKNASSVCAASWMTRSPSTRPGQPRSRSASFGLNMQSFTARCGR